MGKAGSGGGNVTGPGAAGAIYTLYCRAETGEAVKFFYNPHTSELLDEDGDAAIEPKRKIFERAKIVSPDRPGRKSSAPSTLKIQLGLRCNYSCSYCSQSSEIESATVTKTADADEFLRGPDPFDDPQRALG